MPTDTRKLVIRRHRPWFYRLAWGALAVFVVIAVLAAFEAGRRGAGFDGIAAWRERLALRATIRKMEKTNEELRARIAELQTGQVSAEQERAALARTIGELQERIARQNQDLAFYRGIVSSTTAGGAGVRVHEIAVTPGAEPAGYQLKLVLVQTARPDKDISGAVTVSLEGSEADRPVTYPLSQLTEDKLEKLRFSFRYFEDLNQPIVLPDGFRPAHIHVALTPAGSRGDPVTEKFPWPLAES